MKRITLIAIFLLAGAVGACAEAPGPRLTLRENPSDQSISVFRHGEDIPILTQNARLESRPFIHPLGAIKDEGAVAARPPGGAQNGLFWGFAKVNDRDFYSHSDAGYWRRVASRIVTGEGELVGWQTVYQMLDQTSRPILEETQDWTMRDRQSADGHRCRTINVWRAVADSAGAAGRRDDNYQ